MIALTASVLSAAADEKTGGSGRYLRALGTHTSLDVPPMADVYHSRAGFNLAGSDRQMWARIVVMEMPVGFDKAQELIDETRAMLLEKSEPRAINRPDGEKGLLVSGSTKAPTGVLRVEAAVVGTKQRTTSVQCLYDPGAVPAEHRDAFARGLVRMVETLRFEPALKVDLLEGLTFTFVAPTGLVPTGRVMSDVTYAEHDRLPLKAGEPRITVGASDRVAPVSVRKQGERMLSIEAAAYDRFTDVRVRTVGPVKRDDGLHAWEAVADAVHEETKKPVVMYLARVYDDDGTYYVNFFGAAEHEAKYVPAAKAVTESLRIKPPEDGGKP